MQFARERNGTQCFLPSFQVTPSRRPSNTTDAACGGGGGGGGGAREESESAGEMKEGRKEGTCKERKRPKGERERERERESHAPFVPRGRKCYGLFVEFKVV